ncbi:MAG: ABC transporter substrate-binding protein [Desulfomonile tiedjei]|nr:ABC transporter substrate-binding protein [Desulfomonile tiedjei]
MGKRLRLTVPIAALAALLSLTTMIDYRVAEAYQEAPVLSSLVKSGNLPPVDQRLPASPAVVQPIDETGLYGGTWRRAYMGIADLVGARRVLYEPLVRWSPSYRIVPNIAAKWEVENDGRVFTFHLVKGIRWSDGTPFTTDDIMFYFEDILMNKEVTSSIPRWLAPTGTAPKVTKIDDYAFRIEFDKPYGLFIERLACPDGMALVTKPKHYLKQFHKKYAKPEELEALLKERNASSWVKLFHDVSDLKTTLFTDKDMPSLCAWVTRVPAPAKRFVMERNPYYWKVDPAGNQLPYIDTVIHDLQAEAQTIVLKALAGEIDMQGRRLGGMQNSVLLLASVKKGQYKLVPKHSTASVGMLIAPNLNHRDPVTRQILSDARFRKALSHAVNRQEINKIVCRGQGTPRQAAPLKDSAFYSASYEKAYTDYDPGKAGALLDEMGLKKGANGKRIRPDGAPLNLALDVMVSIPTWVDTAEIIASNLKAVGIETEVKSETRELFRQRTQTASHDIALWPGDGGLECLLDPRWYFPYSTESLNAPLYGQWYQSEGTKGEEPPAEIKEVMQTYDRILTTVTEEKQKELCSRIMAANEKYLWVIGLVQNPPDYYVVNPRMFNVPKEDFDSWIYPNPGPVHPEQFFYKPVK